MNTIRTKIEAVRADLQSVIRGKNNVIDLLLTAVLAGGNVLMDDVPGVGKTTLAKALARSVDAVFKRIQFTSDLLPADILGASVFNPASSRFLFNPGPIFANIVLADEINRASPRTQSALLEAMNEKQVSIEGKLYPLPDPFLVIATENPVEYFGTYPLPEAQLDRFSLRIELGYPDPAAEMEMLEARSHASDPMDRIQPNLSCGDLASLRTEIAAVELERTVADYLLRIVRTTRSDDRIRLGASPRAFLTYASCVRALAWLRGRPYVTPDDVRFLAEPVLAHRLMLEPRTAQTGVRPGMVLADLLKTIDAPA